jgi:tetratricopeptide (TPR) repeat protein
MEKKNWEDYFNALKAQDWEAAKNSLQKIVLVDRKNPLTFLKLGDVYQRTGDSVNAIASYHQAAWLLRSQGFFQKAIALYKIILRLDPYNSEAATNSKELMMELETAKTPVPTTPAQEGPAAETEEAFAASLAEKTPESINSELFSGKSEEEVQQILSQLSLILFPSNAKVIEEGDSGDSMYIIKSGRAKVIAHLFGKVLDLATLETGDIFGEVAFLTGRPRTASVIAEGPLEVYELSRVELEKIIDNNPSLLQKIEDFYECRVQDTIKKVKS